MQPSLPLSRRLAVAILVGLAAGACGAKEKETEPITPVEVAPAIRGSIRQIVTADAVLYPRDQANIVPKISAPIRRFLVKRGDQVKQGQLLAELENRDLVAAVAAAKGQYDQAQSSYRSTTGAGVPEQMAKAQSDVDSAREGLDAAKRLLDSRQQLLQQGAIARKSVDEAAVAYAQAKNLSDVAQQHLSALQMVGKDEQIKTVASQLESAKAQYESAQAQLSYAEIRSPIAGVVTDRPGYVGEMSSAGTPMVTVMDTSAIVARINLAPDLAKNLKVGDEAMLTPTDGGEALSGKVSVVSPAADSNSTTFQVWVQADNPGGQLRPGSSAHVSIVADTIDGVVLIPATAILPGEEGGTVVVTVDEKDTAHKKKVEIGAKEGDLAQVSSGLEPGERVVTVGGLGLDDKAKVKVLKPGDKKAGEDKDDKEDEK